MVPRLLAVAALEVVELVASVVVEDYDEDQRMLVGDHPHRKQFRHYQKSSCWMRLMVDTCLACGAKCSVD